MTHSRRLRRGALAALLTGLLALSILAGSRLAGLFWSNGAGKLYGLADGAFVSIDLMPRSTIPALGPLLTPAWSSARGFGPAPTPAAPGSAALTPLTASALSLDAWLAIPAALAVGLFAWAFWRDRIRHAWACTTCNYDRRGLPHKSPCPECGNSNRAITEPVLGG